MKYWQLLVVALSCSIAQIASPLTVQAAAPKIALNAMPKSAISLKWETLPRVLGNYPVAIHVFCAPKGHSKEREQMFAEKRSGPITRKDIDTGPSIANSPFWFDVWALTGTSASTWTRLNRVAFTQSKDVQEIALRWLDPQTKSKPFLAMHFGYTHWHEWETFTFANGWAKPAHVRTFLWGGEGGSSIMQRFDQTRDGRMVVVETEFESDVNDANDKGKTTRSTYRWNNREWLDATQKYFVIGGTFRIRKEAETWRAQNGWGEVVRSNDYPKLRSGYFIVVLDRFRSLKDANERLKLIGADERNAKFKAYVRRAL